MEIEIEAKREYIITLTEEETEYLFEFLTDTLLKRTKAAKGESKKHLIATNLCGHIEQALKSEK